MGRAAPVCASIVHPLEYRKLAGGSLVGSNNVQHFERTTFQRTKSNTQHTPSACQERKLVNDLIEKLQQSSRDEKRQADEARQQAQRVSSELADAKARLTDAKQQHSASRCSARVPPHGADLRRHPSFRSSAPVGPVQDSRPPKAEGGSGWMCVRVAWMDG